MSDCAFAIRPAVPSSVPSPPSTTMTSTWRGSSSRSTILNVPLAPADLASAAVSGSKTGVMCRCSSHEAIWARWLAARSRCAFATMPTARIYPRPFKCRKNSRLPVSPVIGDSVIAARTNPTSAAAAAASSTTRVCTLGSRTTPFLPTSARPASNWGLTSATMSAPSRSSGGIRGKM